MTLDRVPSPYYYHDLERFHQGDILKNIEVIDSVTKSEEGESRIRENVRILNYAIVVSQECDLDRDYKDKNDQNRITDDKLLLSVLLIPAYPAESLKKGEHISAFKMQSFNSDRWKPLRGNQNFRYHYFPGFLDLQVPELVADFKHYFTIPRDILYFNNKNDSHYVASLLGLFREDLSIRFAAYLSRVGLPVIEPSEPEEECKD